MTTVLNAEAIGAPTQLIIAGRWMDASDGQRSRFMIPPPGR